MVTKILFGSLHSASDRAQKKLAARMSSLVHFSAREYAIVVFPVPASPLIQRKCPGLPTTIVNSSFAAFSAFSASFEVASIQS